MRLPRAQARNPNAPENDEREEGMEDPEDFLDRAHPENDQYMQAVEHVQRQIMHQTTILRTKQVKILKTVFSGANYTEAAAKNQTTAPTVSRLVKSEAGQRLLNLLQYHLKLIEGPNEAQRRNMLWRIAVSEELIDPKTSIKAIEALNKMHGLIAPDAQAVPQQQAVVININQAQLPRGALD